MKILLPLSLKERRRLERSITHVGAICAQASRYLYSLLFVSQCRTQVREVLVSTSIIQRVQKSRYNTLFTLLYLLYLPYRHPLLPFQECITAHHTWLSTYLIHPLPIPFSGRRSSVLCSSTPEHVSPNGRRFSLLNLIL